MQLNMEFVQGERLVQQLNLQKESDVKNQSMVKQINSNELQDYQQGVQIDLRQAQ